MDTYKMEFTCNNCHHSFNRDIPKGEKARGQGGECPYCGCRDYPLKDFNFRKPNPILTDRGSKEPRL